MPLHQTPRGQAYVKSTCFITLMCTRIHTRACSHTPTHLHVLTHIHTHARTHTPARAQAAAQLEALSGEAHHWQAQAAQRTEQAAALEQQLLVARGHEQQSSALAEVGWLRPVPLMLRVYDPAACCTTNRPWRCTGRWVDCCAPYV